MLNSVPKRTKPSGSILHNNGSRPRRLKAIRLVAKNRHKQIPLSTTPLTPQTHSQRSISIGSIQQHTQSRHPNSSNPHNLTQAPTTRTRQEQQEELFASEIHSISTIPKVYPNYYISNLPGLYPTTPFVYNHKYLTQRRLRQFLPPPPLRIGAQDPPPLPEEPIVYPAGAPNDNFGLWDSAQLFLMTHGGSLHPNLQLGNMFTPTELNSLCDRRAAAQSLFPHRPSWFGDRISDDWGLVATEDIAEGSVLMRVPSSLFIRAHGLIQPVEYIDVRTGDTVSNLAADGTPHGVGGWFGNRNKNNKSGDRARELQYQQRLDVLSLIQSSLHLIGDSAVIFTAKEDLEASHRTLHNMQNEMEIDAEENKYVSAEQHKELKQRQASIHRKMDKIKQNQRKLTHQIDNTPVEDHYYKQVISQALFLLLVKSLGEDYLLKPFLDILPQSYPTIDLLNDPESMFTEFNHQNNPPLTMDQFAQDIWLPSLQKLTLKDIPPTFLDALGTVLGTISQFNQNTTLAQLLFHYLKDGLGLTQPGELLPQLLWAVNTVNQKLIRTLPKDPYNTRPLSSNFLYAPLHHGIIPMTELFRQAEQPNCVMTMASYLERGPNEDVHSDDFNDDELGVSADPSQPVRRFKRVPYQYHQNDMEYGLKTAMSDAGIDVDGMGSTKKGGKKKVYDGSYHTNPSSPGFFNYNTFFFEIAATRDIKRGEEVTICAHHLKKLEMPIITPKTEARIQNALQRADRLKDLMRFSLGRVPQIVNDYQDQAYLYTNYPGDLPLTHGVVPQLQLKSKIALLPPTHQTITRELTPAYSYLAPGFVSQYPTGINYRTSGRLQYQGNLNDLQSLDQLSPQDRKLVQYSEDSFPYLSYHDAPLKYIVPSYYDDFDLLELFADDRRYNLIYDAFFNPPGFVDRHQQFEMTWLGPNNPNLEAFYRFYMAPGFMAPHPDKISTILQQFHTKKAEKESVSQTNRNTKTHNRNQQQRQEQPQQSQQQQQQPHPVEFTHKTSHEFVLDQFKNRFNFIADIAEANYKALHGIDDPDGELSASQWIKAFSVKLDDENEQCKFIGLYQSAARLSERMALKQNFRHLINAYEEVMVDPLPVINAREKYQREQFEQSQQQQQQQQQSPNKSQHYSPHPYDIAMSLNVKYNQTALASHLTKVFAGRLGLDGHHLLAHDQVKRILHKNGVGGDYDGFNLPSAVTSHQAQFHLAQQQRLQPLIDSHREAVNGGLSIPPRWHCLDGLPYDRFNSYYQHELFMNQRQSGGPNQPWSPDAFLQAPTPFNPQTGQYQGSSTSTTNAPRYRPYVPQ